MNVLVTGGAGFIGSHMAEGILAAGHRVVVVDNESTGKRENVPKGAAYFRGDVANLEDLEKAFQGGLDAVCHIAGQVSILRSFTDPVADLRTNTQGTVNVLQLCVKYQVPRLIYASSMTNYGHTEVLPIPETHPCEPTSYYGITKYAAERYVQATGVPVQREQESWRSPLASIPPFGRGFSRHRGLPIRCGFEERRSQASALRSSSR